MFLGSALDFACNFGFAEVKKNALGIKNKEIYFVMLSFFRNFATKINISILHFMKTDKQSLLSKDGVNLLIPFALITSCFALWGFANDITNPMVKAFSKIFRMSGKSRWCLWYK